MTRKIIQCLVVYDVVGCDKVLFSASRTITLECYSPSDLDTLFKMAMLIVPEGADVREISMRGVSS